MKLWLAVLIAGASLAGPAAAVDLRNSDAVAHRVLVCDEGCTFDAGTRGDGVFTLSGELEFDIAPYATVTGLCPTTCVILVEDEPVTLEDMAFSDEFSGNDQVVIRDGFTYPAD